MDSITEIIEKRIEELNHMIDTDSQDEIKKYAWMYARYELQTLICRLQSIDKVLVDSKELEDLLEIKSAYKEIKYMYEDLCK